MSDLTLVILRNVFASRPAASIPGRLFFATDTLITYRDNGTTWDVFSGTGTGTVTSVGLTMPAEFTVAGSPVTSSGTLAVTKATQTANKVFASPATGAAAAPTFRALVAADLPAGTVVTPGGTPGQVQYDNAGAFGGFTVGGDGTLNTSTGALAVTKTGGVAFAASATTDTTNATNITSGTLAAARVATLNQNTTGSAANVPASGITGATLPVGVTSAPGLTTAAGGTFGTAAFTASSAYDVAGAAATAQTNAEAAFTGDVTKSAGSFVTTVTMTSGVAFAPSATTDTTNATNITSGTLPAAQLPLGSSSAFGAVKVDGTSIGAVAGVISAIGAPPSGAAGGDLSGTYPNPGVAATGGVPFAASATTDTTNASNISSGTLAAARVATLNQNTTGSAGSVAAANITGTTLPAAITSAPGLTTAAGGAFGTAAFTASSAYDVSGAATAAQTAATAAFTGDVTKTAGSFAATVTGINGTSLAALATGILKNTTGTGVPSIAIAADIPDIAESQVTNLTTDLAARALLTTNTFSGVQTLSAAGAASTPVLAVTGALFTGGTGTTTLPEVLLQPTGTTAAITWATTGTMLGVNLPSGFAGNVFDLHANGGASLVSLTSSGVWAVQGYTIGVTVSVTSNLIRMAGTTGVFSWSTGAGFSGAQDVGLSRAAAGILAVGNGTQGNATGVLKAAGVLPGILYSAAGTPLPTAAVGITGQQAVVSDATLPTYMGAYVSGGTITAAVICSFNGTIYAWLTH